MHNIIINILGMLAFTQAMRYSQRRSGKDYLVGAINYVFAGAVAAAMLAALWLLRARPELLPTFPIGALAGVGYVVQLFLLLAAFRIAGVGISMAMASMGILVAILVSFVAWGEPMTPTGWIATGLLPVAILLVRPGRGSVGHLSLKADLLLAAIFLNGGIIATCHTAVSIYATSGGDGLFGLEPYRLVYTAGLFSAGAVTSLAYAVRRGGRWDRKDLALGTFMGVVNLLITLTVVAGVAALSAAVFFPTVQCGFLLLIPIACINPKRDHPVVWPEAVGGDEQGRLEVSPRNSVAEEPADVRVPRSAQSFP